MNYLLLGHALESTSKLYRMILDYVPINYLEEIIDITFILGEKIVFNNWT
jgi:hypothetical protein